MSLCFAFFSYSCHFFGRSVKPLLLLFCSLCVSNQALAWSEYEHMVIAEAALEKLPPKLQRQLEQQAFAVVKQLDNAKRLYLLRRYPKSSAFAQMSVFADETKNLSVQTLYNSYAGTTTVQELPAALQPLANDNSRTWHYHNVPYYPYESTDRQACNFDQPQSAVWAIDELTKAFKETENKQQQNLIIALLVHYVADLHQPLHAISRIEDNCKSDRGGNGFCFLKKKDSWICKRKLHQAWDSALDYFEDISPIVENGAQILRSMHYDDQLISETDTQDWLKESAQHARFIYSLTQGKGADKYYLEDGQKIALKRMSLASKRIGHLLQSLYPYVK